MRVIFGVLSRKIQLFCIQWTGKQMDNFIEKLSSILSDCFSEEKYIIAPSLRTGHQWLDRITRSGKSLLNVRVCTFRGLVFDVTMPAGSGAGMVNETDKLALTAQAFKSLKENDEGYLSCLTPGYSLYKKVMLTLDELRLSGKVLTGDDVESFELRSKGREINFLFSRYSALLKEHFLHDYSDVLRIALKEAKKNPDILKNKTVIMPESSHEELKGLEKDFWNSVSPGTKRTVEDFNLNSGEPVRSDAELLKWVLNATDAPAPVGDGSVKFFSAVGETTEIEHVFRSCIYNNIPLDDVEIVCSDYSCYAPVIFKAAHGLYHEISEEIPVTFEKGIPARFSRPGKLLSAVVWQIRNRSGGKIFRQIIREGLVSDETSVEDIRTSVRRIEEAEENHKVFLKEMKYLLEERGNTENRFDEYSRKFYLEQIEIFSKTLSVLPVYELNIADWLDDLICKGVDARPPLPGCVFVSSVTNGGHSGRKHTFVVGLDDGRFPVSGSQDPLLLDSERRKLCEELTLSSSRLKRSARDLEMLFSRLTGEVTLSFSCRNIAEGSENFPSSLLLSIHRLLSGSNDTVNSFPKWAGTPISPYSDKGPVFSESEWLVSGFCKENVKEPLSVCAETFSNLKYGINASEQRDSNLFTEYDGFVPEAGLEKDPYTNENIILSSSRLEFLAKNPFDYFLKYILEVKPSEDDVIEPGIWLNAIDKGTVLHDTFRDFMSGLKGEGKMPAMTRDYPVIIEILDKRLAEELKKNPCPDEMVYQRERSELLDACRVFLLEEINYLQEIEPMYFEAALGMTQYDQSTGLDAPEPVRVVLTAGGKIRIRGKIDRVDRKRGTNEFLLWDYKSGGTYIYRKNDKDRFKNGRVIQNAFYLALIEKRLKEVHPGAVVSGFGYFFPGRKGKGERIWWNRHELDGGLDIIELLCNMLKEGSFPSSDESSDLKYSDCIPPGKTGWDSVFRIIEKMGNPVNKKLDCFRKLRGKSKENGDD